MLAGEGVSSADHAYAAGLNLARIPAGYDNTVIEIRIPASRADKQVPIRLTSPE